MYLTTCLYSRIDSIMASYSEYEDITGDIVCILESISDSDAPSLRDVKDLREAANRLEILIKAAILRRKNDITRMEDTE